jgi:hypothetical protein
LARIPTIFISSASVKLRFVRALALQMELRDRKEPLQFLESEHVLIEKVGQLFRDMLKFLESEHVLIEKVGQLFRDMLWQAAL